MSASFFTFKQYATPSNFTPSTTSGTALTVEYGERGFIQNLAAAPLAVKFGSSAATNSFSLILKAGSSANDGNGGSVYVDDYLGTVSVIAMSGTENYIAWKGTKGT